MDWDAIGAIARNIKEFAYPLMAVVGILTFRHALAVQRKDYESKRRDHALEFAMAKNEHLRDVRNRIDGRFPPHEGPPDRETLHRLATPNKVEPRRKNEAEKIATFESRVAAGGLPALNADPLPNARQAEQEVDFEDHRNQIDAQLRLDLIFLFNHFETLAIEIDFETADEEVAFESLGNTLVAYVDRFGPFLESRREAEGSGRLYKNLRPLAARWKEQLKNPDANKLRRVGKRGR